MTASQANGAGENATSAPSARLSPPSREIELKLLVSVGSLDKVRAAPVIVRNARNKGIVRHLSAIYYDTADHLLLANGVTLRVRSVGKRFLQTVKRQDRGGDLLIRPEWEMPVAAMRPDLAVLPIAEIGAPFDTLAEASLLPLFSTNVRRRQQTIVLPDGIVEVAFDDGRIEFGDRHEPLSEVELELKAGDVGVLYEVGMALLEAEPLRIGTRSKSDRGYALALDRHPKAAKANDAPIELADNVDATIAKVLANCRNHLLANLDVAEKGRDPDGVHQMRVALRRMRTALSIFRREIPGVPLETLANDAKVLAKVLGPARSWDVFITTTLAEIRDAQLPGVDFATLENAAETFRERNYVALREALADPQANRFMLSVGRTIERRSWRNDVPSDGLSALAEPVKNLADRTLARIQRKALKRGRHFGKMEPEARHKLRLTLKKLRYALEFFQPLYAKAGPTKDYLKCLSRLQDALGAYNDAQTTQPLLREIEDSTPAPEVHKAAGAIIGWQGFHGRQSEAVLAKRWRSFRKAEPFWAN